MRPLGRVILSETKNLSERPFVSLRVTTLLCQSSVVRFSHAVMNGVDLFTVGKLLGHRTIQQTQRYAHLAPDHMRNAVEQTAHVLFALDTPRDVPHEAVSAA